MKFSKVRKENNNSNKIEELEKSLTKFENSQLFTQYKFGIINAIDDQTEDDQFFNNRFYLFFNLNYFSLIFLLIFFYFIYL